MFFCLVTLYSPQIRLIYSDLTNPTVLIQPDDGYMDPEGY